MLVSDLVESMRLIAPPELAEEWDNVGLLVGDLGARLRGPVLCAIDLTDAVLDEALEMGAGAIVAYHPVIFKGMPRVTSAEWRGRLLLRLIGAGLAVYCPHTALDAAPGGMTDWLLDQVATEEARTGGGKGRRALVPAVSRGSGQEYKIVVFTPAEAVERVRDAMAWAGAGVIGNYELCSFTVGGQGSFRGNLASNPFVGRAGELEFVEEVRLEMVCARGALADALAALRSAHPYEEPAFDVLALANRPMRESGSGRIVALESPASLEELGRRLWRRLAGARVCIAAPPGMAVGERTIARVAAVPGSGAALLDAAIAGGAECFVTGEMKHHEVLGALERGRAVILAGHTETERGYMGVLAERLRAGALSVDARVSLRDAAPLRELGA